MARAGELSLNGRTAKVSAPRIERVVHQEAVLDVRCCVTAGCRFLHRTTDRQGRSWGGCAAGVYRAAVPLEELYAEVRENPSPEPDPESPFLLRLLMAPECTREECGVTHIERTERIPEQLAAEQEGSLFA